MSSEDWYRNEIWNDEIEEAFFKKLSRARSQKSQYLKIQAWYLIDSNPEVVSKLAKYFRDNCPEDFWEQELCLYESRALRNLGQDDLAISKAKESLAWRVKKPNTQTEIPYWFAELVLKSMNSKEYASALEALEEFHEDTPFPITQFYFYGYAAILLNRLGENSSAIPLAAKALDWASKDKNLLQNPRKRKLGLFKKNSVWAISEIEQIASA